MWRLRRTDAICAKTEYIMRLCPKCNAAMVNAACYDPEGAVPLVTETDSDGRVWACI